MVGRVVGVGLVDEITDRQYVVVDGADGRVHYAEPRAPQRRCRAAVRHDRQARRRSAGGPAASVFTHRGSVAGEPAWTGDLSRPTWLDELISGKECLPRLSTGFGSEVERARCNPGPAG